MQARQIITTRLLITMHQLNTKELWITIRPNKKKPEIPITLPTINYPVTPFHIFICMQIYANFYLNILIYAHFKANFYANFSMKLEDLTECQRKCFTEMRNYIRQRLMFKQNLKFLVITQCP